MARRKNDAANESTAPVVDAVFEEATAPKKRSVRRKKEDTADIVKKVTPAKKKSVARAPRQKEVIPNFVIQDTSDHGITYEQTIKKVSDVVSGMEISSLDVYVKADEGKAYYVVNGNVMGAVDLF